MISNTQTDRSPGVVSLCSVIWQSAGQFYSPTACYSCRSSALSLSRLPGHLSLPPSWQAATPLLTSCQALCLSQRWQIISVFQLQVLCPLAGSPSPSAAVLVLLSAGTLAAPSSWTGLCSLAALTDWVKLSLLCSSALNVIAWDTLGISIAS